MKMRFWKALTIVPVIAVLLALPAFADSQLTVSSVSGEVGEQVTVEITLSGEDIYAGNFSIMFDNSALNLVKAEKIGDWIGEVNPGDNTGEVKVSFVSVNEPVPAGTVCAVTFEIRSAVPLGGSPVTIESARFYGEEGNRLSDVIISGGTVTKECVEFRLESAEAIEDQAVRVVVSSSGAIQPAGANFSVSYDSDVLTPTAVLPLDGLGNAQVTSNLTQSGEVKIAFAGNEEIAGGEICVVVFQVVGQAGEQTSLSLNHIRAYDTNAGLLDSEAVGGTVDIVLPSEKDPKLWVVGGALNDDGTAEVGIVLQGRGVVCGGQFILQLPAQSEAVILSQGENVVVNGDQPGRLRVSWAGDTPWMGEAELVTLKLSSVAEGDTVTFSGDVRLYDAESKIVPVVDIRDGTMTGRASVNAVAEVHVQSVEEGQGCVITAEVDLVDIGYYGAGKTEQVTPVLAVYRDQRLVGVTMQGSADLSNGVAEISMEVTTRSAPTRYQVLLLDEVNILSPLCDAIGEVLGA